MFYYLPLQIFFFMQENQIDQTDKSSGYDFFINSRQSQTKSDHNRNLNIEGTFYFKQMLKDHGQYMMYKGVDIENIHWVHIYSKQINSQFKMSSHVKESFRNHLCPKILWFGEIKTEKERNFYEVHQKYGPSLKTMFSAVKRRLKEKELLHLMLQLIKLVEKMNNLKLICGQLDPQMIVFDASPQKNELYLLNSFRLKKKNTELGPLQTKYCSRGAHLGRILNIKDDLQSICYILMDIFLEGRFLAGKTKTKYEQIKLRGQINELAEQVPQVLKDFYHYILSLNFDDEIKFFSWKNYLTSFLSNDIVNKPYAFLRKERAQKRREAEMSSQELEQQTVEEQDKRVTNVTNRGINCRLAQGMP